LNNTATDPNFIVDIASGSTGKFAVQSSGTDFLKVEQVASSADPYSLGFAGTGNRITAVLENGQYRSALQFGEDNGVQGDTVFGIGGSQDTGATLQALVEQAYLILMVQIIELVSARTPQIIL
jgi:hypothetical protein